MSQIVGLILLPPIAVARLGSSPVPVDAYDLEPDPKDPLGYRRIVPMPSLEVDPDSGEITRVHTPKSIQFRDKTGVRPVAPFFEVHARMRDDSTQPLTHAMLLAHGCKPSDVIWKVQVGNFKAFRRTGDAGDKVSATVTTSDHDATPLHGLAPNFLPGKCIPFGSVRYIKPSASSDETGHVRLRFTPATGKVYGASRSKRNDKDEEIPDPLFCDDERIVYDHEKGRWRGFQDETSNRAKSDPSDVYEGYTKENDENKLSFGYLDDVCDGRVTVMLGEFSASALISVGVPAFAPDSLPLRTVADEIEQALLGPVADASDRSLDDAIEIVRRSLDMVRHINTAVMNGNTMNGRIDVVPTMGSNESNDYGRYFEPIVAPSLVDNLAVRTLHARILGALHSGSAPWFARVLRQPEEIGDLSDVGRRKMPPMLRGSDGCALTLTRRQIDKIARAAEPAVRARNRSAQSDQLELSRDDNSIRKFINALEHPTGGNPISALPVSAISNCFPGLEFDFRNFWRRTFEGIVLLEWDNLVVECDPGLDLKHHRLLRVENRPIVVPLEGPNAPGADPSRLRSDDNPHGAMSIEFSNALAFALQRQGEEVLCEFTRNPSLVPVLPGDASEAKTVALRVRKFFDPDTATPRAELLIPGELTQSLCSPWQHDYRECACYYWPATRPDFVNIEVDADGVSRGDNWLAKDRVGRYVLDDRKDSRMVTYEELFEKWEKMLHFVIAGRDSKES